MAQQSTGPNHPLNPRSLFGSGDRGAMLAGNGRRDRRSRQRRGVLLLVCLVLLVMFLMLGVTFVLTAGNFRRSSEAYQRMLERPSADIPERSGDLLDSVARDFVRGTSNQDSPFAQENLLEDLYGGPALRGVINKADAVPAGFGSTTQLTELRITEDGDFTPPKARDYYAGQVLTFLSGPARGRSTRIVGWDGADVLTVVALPPAAGVLPGELNNAHFLVNGRPFSGDGSAEAEKRRSLNEDYDKADANNPWLFAGPTSSQVSFANQPDWVNNTAGLPCSRPETDSSGDPVVSVDNDGDGTKDSVWMDVGLPLQLQPDGSYVKPLVAMMVRDLDGRVNVNLHGSVAQQVATMKQYSLVTSGAKYADGTPYAYQAVGEGYGPSEIDPFFALNVRASSGIDFDIDAFLGGRLHLDNPKSANGQDLMVPEDGMPNGSDLSYPGESNQSQQLLMQFLEYGDSNAISKPLDAHGQGYSEANDEGVIIGKVVPDPATLTSGSPLTDVLLETHMNAVNNPYCMEPDTAEGGKAWHTPYSPADLEGVLRATDADADGLAASLYEDLAKCLQVTPSGSGSGSTLTIDATSLKALRERITTESWDLPVPGLGWPAEFTVPGTTDPLLSDTENPGHITDLFAARFKKEDSSITDSEARRRAAALVADVGGGSPHRHLIAPGLLRGTRMNVNRLFGNGVDDDSDGAIDDPSEAGVETITGAGFSGEPFDHDGDGTITSKDQRARQHYAQQLYLLMMLLADDLETNVPGGTDPNDQRRLLARRLAQFAVNAVDYRDPDAIMTGFEYDANPFDAGGWMAEADGDLTTAPATKTEYGVVWGCESPAAVLTQTLAFHDRRVRDDASIGGQCSELDWSELQSRLDVFVGNAANAQQGQTLDITDQFINDRMQELRTANDPSSGDDAGLPFEDPHFDQVARPEGAFFFEVQAVPQAFDADKFSQELYELYDGEQRLDLARRSPDGYPIWRVAISDPLPPKPDAKGVKRAQLGDPPYYTLRDADADGEATAAEGSAEAWNSYVTMQPESFDPLEHTSGGGSNEVLDQIPIERIVYFDYNYGSKVPYPGRFRGSTQDTALKTHQQSLPGVGASWDGNYYCELKDDPLDTDKRYAYRIRADIDSAMTPEDRTLVVGPQDVTTIRGSSFNGGSDISLATVDNNATVERSNLNTGSTQPLLSISEPIASELTPPGNLDYYKANDAAGGSSYVNPIDKPFDHDADWLRALANVFEAKQQSYPPAGSPQTLTITDPNNTANPKNFTLEDALTVGGGQRFFTPQWAVIEEGTVPHYRTAFLQRLADPTMAWNKTTNPYLTVDAMPIDLNVYNSDSTTADPWQKRKPMASKGETSVAENAFGNYDPTLKSGQLATDIEVAIRTVRSSAGHAGASATSQFEFPGTIEPLSQIRRRSNLFGGAGQLTSLSGSPPFASPSALCSKTSPPPFWPNRPLISEYELLMVPASEPGKLTFELGTHTGTKETSFTAGFPHLLNFMFQTSSGGTSTAEPQLGRIFEYLHVPSKYAGTQRSLSSSQLQAHGQGFAPPFNVISTYREPGRVNLNTVTEDTVWESVMHGPSSNPASHVGPTRSNLSKQTWHGPGTVAVIADSDTGGGSGNARSMPLLDSSLNFEGSDTANPFLRYRSINRMGNLVTTRSNLYAVWMTLGLFETEDGSLPLDSSGSGKIDLREAGGSDKKRHRAFYLIDRSIPVGYETGQDHNTENVFRVKRYIE